jgi:hypothetical protein
VQVGIAEFAEQLQIEAYDELGLRELEYAMSAVGSTPVSHRIGVLMTPEGRFLEWHKLPIDQ